MAYTVISEFILEIVKESYVLPPYPHFLKLK